MRYLFIHDALPGQFIHLMQHLKAEGGHEIVGASRAGSVHKLPVQQVVYDLPKRLQSGDSSYAEQAIGLGLNLYRKLNSLKAEGFQPDYIISHASKGASYFLRDLYPNARIISFLEWYYRPPQAGEASDAASFVRKVYFAEQRNMPINREMEMADALFSPTEFQKSQFPASLQHRINVLHEGVDTELYHPDPDAVFEHEGLTVRQGDEVITYAARGMEPIRGFKEFMRLVEVLQKQRPNLQVMIAAADRVCYGGAKGPGLGQWAKDNIDYDPERTHFLGLLPKKKFATFLEVSRVHVYLTKPFVLSWSMLNAMSCGTLVIGSNTAPVAEVITDGVNGLLVQMDDTEKMAAKVGEVLDNPQGFEPQAVRARETILQHYDCKQNLSAQLALIHGK